MKIIIHSMAELLELAELVTFGKVPPLVRVDDTFELPGAAQFSRDAFLSGLQVETQGLPADIAQPKPVEHAAEDVGEPATDDLPSVDADGAHYDREWHSSPAKINADGRWKARRKRDEDAYKAWLQELDVQAAETAVAADADPVATETHALPQDDGDVPAAEPEQAGSDTTAAPDQTGPTVDLQALVAAAFDQAASQSTDVRELLNAAQAFTTAHGHAKFNELKSAVAPIDGNPFGKALQLFTPEERQLMMACLANYPSN